ncbi:MAG: hypothetical protein LKJ95_10435 [Bacteroidales bacterium]|nr:hypothetical protein [Bacteroidales bacterium]
MGKRVREFSRTVSLPYDTDCHNERRRILARNTRRMSLSTMSLTTNSWTG